MSALLAVKFQTGPQPRLWTVGEFHQLGDLGLLEGRRAVLLDGVILEQGPMNPPHAIAATKTEDLIRESFGKGWHVRVQKPLVLGQATDPEPDVAVLPGRPADYPAHPTTAALVVEVADSSLRFDTGEKLAWYAAAGIPEYWVLDVNARQLLAYRDPDPAGRTYRTQLTRAEAESVSPLAAPTASLRVADLLP